MGGRERVEYPGIFLFGLSSKIRILFQPLGKKVGDFLSLRSTPVNTHLQSGPGSWTSIDIHLQKWTLRELQVERKHDQILRVRRYVTRKKLIISCCSHFHFLV